MIFRPCLNQLTVDHAPPRRWDTDLRVPVWCAECMNANNVSYPVATVADAGLWTSERTWCGSSSPHVSVVVR